LGVKLQNHGIDGKLEKWIEEWLHGRCQRVCVRGTGSGWARVSSGVPQGSVLGPVLFLIYINDLDCGLVKWISKFADDTRVYGRVMDLSGAVQLQTDLDTLFQWSREWQMMLNVSKCKVMHFGSNNMNFNYNMNG